MAHTEHCRDLLGSLSEYIDGTAEASICLEIERHLSDCENCRVVVDTLRKTVYVVQATAAEEPEIPDSVRSRLYHVLNLEDYLDINET
jgi:predicted anti-sigma-YlaC factor YlaD